MGCQSMALLISIHFQSQQWYKRFDSAGDQPVSPVELNQAPIASFDSIALPPYFLLLCLQASECPVARRTRAPGLNFGWLAFR